MEAAPGAAMSAFALLVITGAWMAWIYLPGFHGLFNPANPIGMLVGVKLMLLAATAALAIHARLQLIPSPPTTTWPAWPGISARSPPWRSPLWWWVR